MGFTNETSGGGGNGKYASFKKGRIVTKIDGEKKDFAAVTGTITEVWTENAEFQNKPYSKLVVRIDDENGFTLLGFAINSGYGNAFCRILPNIDPTKPVEISGNYTADKADPTRGYTSLFIAQEGKSLKWYYTNSNEAGKKVPAIKETEVGKGKSKQIIKDYSDREDFFERLLVGFSNKLESLYGKKKKAIPATADEVTEPMDGLPFD